MVTKITVDEAHSTAICDKWCARAEVAAVFPEKEEMPLAEFLRLENVPAYDRLWVLSELILSCMLPDGLMAVLGPRIVRENAGIPSFFPNLYGSTRHKYSFTVPPEEHWSDRFKEGFNAASLPVLEEYARRIEVYDKEDESCPS